MYNNTNNNRKELIMKNRHRDDKKLKHVGITPESKEILDRACRKLSISRVDLLTMLISARLKNV